MGMDLKINQARMNFLSPCINGLVGYQHVHFLVRSLSLEFGQAKKMGPKVAWTTNDKEIRLLSNNDLKSINPRTSHPELSWRHQQTLSFSVSSTPMAAATLSLSFSVDPQHHRHHFFKPRKTFPFTSPAQFPKYPLPPLLKSDRYLLKSSSSCSSSSSSSSSSTTTTVSPTLSYLSDPLRTGRFLTNEELEKLKFLEDFAYSRELRSGYLWVRAMRAEEMDITVALLAESFAESMLLPSAYNSLLRFFVRQYLIERRAVMPHAITLVGFFRERKRNEDNGGDDDDEEEEAEGEEELAGTVEVCFDKRGANASPPTPTPPKNSPYICNMTVKEQLRRRGIGWHLLKASEELISQMSSSNEVYLHCRMIDEAPFNMYTKAGYHVVKTDSLLILLMLQRRKHLMCKKLSVVKSPLESDLMTSNEELTRLKDFR